LPAPSPGRLGEHRREGGDVRSPSRIGAAARGKKSGKSSGLLLGAVMMLVHIGQIEEAAEVHNAWLRTRKTAFIPTTFTRKASVKKKSARKSLPKQWSIVLEKTTAVQGR